jgi:hypothetical protein
MHAIAVSTPSDSRTTATRPSSTTKNGVLGAPASAITSPGRTRRAWPCGATRATCAAESVGNAPLAPPDDGASSSGRMSVIGAPAAAR